MKFRLFTATLALGFLPGVSSAQTANPVAQAFREDAAQVAKNLIAAADEIPADKYKFKPTPAQMSVGDVVNHLSQGNDFLCGMIGGVKAPTRTKVDSTATKDAMMARLRETFVFCDQALAPLDDSKLAETFTIFGGRKATRAAVMTLTTADWADHYGQLAIYMRLNGMLPPTAKKPAM